MKNVHVLPTDKPSRLRIGDNGNVVLGLMQNSIVSRNDNFTNHHIYITSDEKIKERDYFISKEGTIHDEFGGGYGDKKVILTTDQDLIDNGVQAITNTFAEWFVKNPSCEVIQVENEMVASKPSSIERWDYKYKIIIPEEEAKQETLEEAAEKEFPLIDTEWCKTGAAEEENLQLLGHRKSFIEGAKGGFDIAIKIIPYLVAMLVAISVLRSSGAFEFITNGFTSRCLSVFFVIFLY
jgi:hypothetical protein